MHLLKDDFSAIKGFSILVLSFICGQHAFAKDPLVKEKVSLLTQTAISIKASSPDITVLRDKSVQDLEVTYLDNAEQKHQGSLKITKQKDEIQIVVQIPQNDSISVVPLKRKLTVQVPEGKLPDNGKFTIESSSGDIQVAGIMAESLSVDTTSGDLKASGLNVKREGKFKASSGDISLTESQFGMMTSESASGDQAFQHISAKFYGKITASSGNVKGDVTTPQLDTNATSGDVTLTNLSQFVLIRTATTSGDVSFTLSHKVGAQIDLRTSSGEFGVAVPLTPEKTEDPDRHFVGRIGDGKARIQITTASGDISLKQK